VAPTCECCGKKLKAKSLQALCEECFVKKAIYCIYCQEERANSEKNYHKHCDEIIEAIILAKSSVKR